MKTSKALAAVAAAVMAVCGFSGCGDVSGKDTAEKITENRATAVSVDDDTKSEASDNTQSSEPVEYTPEFRNDGNVWHGTSDFAVELLKRAAADKQGENVVVSPESAIFCMGLAANGAEGSTRDEMLRVLAGGADLETFNEKMKEWRDRQKITESDDEVPEWKKNLGEDSGYDPGIEPFRIVNANSIWTAPDMAIDDGYAQRINDYFGAESYRSLDMDEMNAWVNEKTDGMIPALIDELPPKLRSVLINTVTFEAQWCYAFGEGEGTFTAADGSVQDVTMLQHDEHYVIHGEHCTGFSKPYSSGHRFVALLPDEGMTANELLQSLNGETLEGLLQSEDYQGEPCAVSIPAFTLDTKLELNDILKDMGIQTSFGEGADFSGMSNEPLFISKVLQQTHLELDKNGTKAASATAAFMTMGIEPVPMEKLVFDRPFVYAIVDPENGQPIFMGIENKIEQ